MSEFDNLPPPVTIDPTSAVAEIMNKMITSVGPSMDGNTACFVLGALKMGREILVALSMTDDELSWARDLQTEHRKRYRESYKNRKPRFDKEAT